VLRANPRCDQKTAITFIDHTLPTLPFAVERVQTDNGSKFGTSFHRQLLDTGIDHVKIKPPTPRLNGKASNDPTASTPTGSTGSSRAKLLTTPAATTTALAALWPAKHPTNDYDRKPKTHCHRPSSVAHFLSEMPQDPIINLALPD
jgi:hypothetical protein